MIPFELTHRLYISILLREREIEREREVGVRDREMMMMLTEILL